MSGDPLRGVTNKDLRQAIKAAIKKGCTFHPPTRKSGHGKVRCPNGRFVVVGMTASSPRSAVAFRMNLKHEGVEL